MAVQRMKRKGEKTAAADATRLSRKSARPLSNEGTAPDADAGMPFTSDDVTREEIRLSFLIHDVSRMRRSAYDQFMKPLGITRAQWWVLAYLSRHDGMMQTQLADVLEVGKASLGDVIESLEGSGWVQRRPDPSDKRAKRVYLARAAQSLIKRMTVLENQFNARILAELSSEERTVMSRGLAKIKEAISGLAPTSNED